MSSGNLKKRIHALEAHRRRKSCRIFNVFGDMSNDEIEQATGHAPDDGDIVFLHVLLGDEQDWPLEDRCMSLAI